MCVRRVSTLWPLWILKRALGLLLPIQCFPSKGYTITHSIYTLYDWAWKRALALSIFNWMSHFRSFFVFDNKWPSESFYQMHFGKIRGVADIHPFITSCLKKNTRTSDYQFNEPPSKLIRLPDLYLTYMPQVHNLQSLHWGLWGRRCHPQRHNSRIFQLRWTKWLSKKIGLDGFGEMVGMRGILLPSNYCLLLKRPQALSNFNRMSSFEASKTKKKMAWNMRCGGFSSSDHSES